LLVKRILGPGLVLSILLALVPAVPASADQLTVSLVHVIATSKWSPPSPDPIGLAYLASSREMVVVDSEVDETKLFHGANVWLTTLAGRVKRSFSTTAYSNEPTDVATGRRSKVLFISDDNQNKVFVVKRGKDRTLGTADDRVSSFSTNAFHAGDPQGLAFIQGDLFIANGRDHSIPAVYRVDKGKNGKFDGPAPGGDDVVRKFNTAPLGLNDPEDVAYDPKAKHLFIVSSTEKLIAETTLDGNPLNMIDISFTGIQEPAGIALAPGSNDRSVEHIYVADRGLDNNPFPNENDGLIVELAAGTGPQDSEPPAPPTGLTVTPLSTGLGLDWADNAEPDIAGYNVYRSNGTKAYRQLNRLLVTTSAFVDTQARVGATSSYNVVAVDTSWNPSTPARASGDRGVIAFRGASTRRAASVDRLTIPRPPRVAPGVALVGSVAVRGPLRVEPPAGWQLVRLQRKGHRLLQAVYVKVAGKGEPGSYTWTFPRATLAAGAIVAYSGVARSDPVDVSAGRIGSPSKRIVAPSVAASSPLELLVGVFGTAVKALLSHPDSMVEQAESRLATGSRGITLEMSDDVLDAAGATGDRAADASKAGFNIGQTLVLRPHS
jgi:hypothetical protein